ncbi:microtubule-associated protein futsch isoform X2 [Nilaparvata lugens]|uniref:microtubule-associated protein futsch isoform X2 n=1 Tax=Nilaparvata lugens TaxID=108931 RepID=UPI00193EA5DE|nr:microtubule-associated protein futsch isoform X2 [Nilaparvata lugens]
MQRWGSKREMMGDDPPYLTVGTEVSAKYKGAFCEAEVRKVVRSVKCKVAFKFGLGNATVTDDQIRGSLRAGSNVEVKHPEKKEFVEATITKIQDCSQYTVVFDDGDITTLRRTALCLKSGRHFAESETLDQLPLTHPEHFGNPVIGGRRGRRNREESSDDDDDCLSTRKGGGGAGGRGSGGRGGGSRMEVEKEADIGKVVCVEMSDKKKQKDNWFPGLVVAPTAQDTVRIHVKEEYLVRSFKDGRYYTVPKKEATSFTREIGSKVDNNTLRTAVDKALLFLDKDELPPHWDRELLFGLEESTGSESDADLDSDSSDNEPREEKDHFVAQLYKFMDDRGTPINKGPTISAKDVDLYKLFMVVQKLGGYNRVTNHNQWKTISHKLGFGQNASTVNLVKHAYKKFLHSFEDFYRKLGCTMLSHPRNNRARHRSSRSLIRDRDRATPKIKDKDGKDSDDPKEASTSQDVIKKEEVVKEEEKPKEVTVVETPKRESRSKEMMRSAKAMTKEDNKVEKKEMEKVQQQQQQQQHEAVATTVKKSVEETRRGGEEGARSKERVKLTASSSNEEQHKANKVMTGRREAKAKQEEKDNYEEKAKSEIKQGKVAAKEQQPKKRSLFEKVTGVRKGPRGGGGGGGTEETSSKPPKAKRPSLGLAAVRQKRSLKDRMKSIVRKFKLKGGTSTNTTTLTTTTNKPLSKTTLLTQQPPTSHNSTQPIPKPSPVTKSLPPPNPPPPNPPPPSKRQPDGNDGDDDDDDDNDDEDASNACHHASKTTIPEVVNGLDIADDDDENTDKNIQLTRSKSKEDIPIRVRKEPTSTDTKKTSSSPQNLSSPNNSKEQSEADKRRGRKRKEDEKGPCEEVLDQLPSYKSVSVGDKLKVYYGPTHESKVTYEAKVLSSKEENSETLYLVHYTGWNTRYDEWIKRSRIADNLSWSPGRVKRNRQPQQQCLRRSAGGAAPTKRGRSSDTGRSTAPSPSPRARLPSSTRTHTRSKQSSRRISAHTDLSDTDSGDESDSESDSESNSPLQKRADKMVGSSDEKDEMEIRTKRRAALAFAHTLSFESKEDKRKPTAPSTSEDERDLEKCKDDVDRKPHERRSASRVSIEKEQNDEQTAERRGRKLRSDRASRPLSDSDEEKDEEKDKREGKRVSLERRKNEESKAKLEVKKESNELDDGQSSRISRTNENSCKDDSDESLAKLRRKTEVHKMECDDGKSQTVDDNTNRSDRLRNRSDNKKRFEAKTTDDTSKFDSKMQSIVDKVLKSTSVEPEIKPEVKEIKEEPASDVSESGENKKKTRYERVKKERNAEDESSQDTERNRRSRRVVMNKKDDAKASSSKDDSDDEVLQQPKGRDFDLMQIRSELKGIDKAVKMPLEVKSSETEVKEIASASDVVKKEPVDVKVKEEQESPTKEAMDLSADDIYEFKEPEPFEFEVRPKCSEEKGGKMQRRTFGRMCDELPKTPSPLKRKLVRSKPSRSPPEVKKRFRRSITKKDECPSSDAKGAAEPETSNQTTEKKSVEKPAVPVKSLIEEQKDIKNVAPKEVIEKEKEIPSRVVGLESSAKPQTNELSVPNDAVKPVLDKVGRGTLDEELNEVKSIDEPVKVAQDATEKKVEEKVAEIVEKGANSIDVDDDDDDDGENRLVIFELDEQEKEKRENAASMSDSKEASKVTVVEMKKEEVKKVEPPTKEVVVEANKDLVTIEKKDDVPKKVEPPKVSVVEEEEEKKRDVKKVVEEKREEVDKSEEEEDDEAINAAIRRVIQQTDEESNDFDSLPPPVRTVAPPPPPPPPQAPQTPSPITSYKKDNKRRKVTISKEFIEESDSDSDVEVKPIPKPTTSISTSLAHSMGTVTTSAPAIQSPVVLQKPVTVTIPSVLKTTTLPVQTSASLKSNFTLSALQGSKITTAACGLIKPTLPGTKILLNVSTSVHRPPMATVATTGHLPILTAIHKPPPLTFTSPLTLTRPCLPLLTQRPPQSTDPSTSKQTLTLPILSAKPIITTSTNLPQTVSNFTLLSSDMKALPHLIPKPNFVTQSTSTSIKSTPILIATTVPTAALTATDTKKLAEKKDSVEVKVEDKCIRIVTVDEASIKTNKAASEISNVAEKKEEVIVATVKDAVKEDKIDVVGNLIQQKKSSTSELVPLPTVVEHKIVPEVIEPVKEVKAADKVVEIQKIVEDKPGKVETKSEEVMKMVLEEMPKTNKVEEEDDEDDIKLEIAVEEEVKSEDEEEERRIMKEFDLAEEETMEADEDDGEVEDEDMDADEEEEEDEVEEREEEEEECVQSLLCEETIPGSPAPPAGKGKGDNDDDDDDDDDDDGESDKRPLAKTNELPFASAPGTSQHSGTSTNHSKPVVQQAPLTRPLLPPPPSAQPPMAVVAPPTAPPDTPPTTPDSSLSPISNSPRGERSGSSPGLDNDSTKSQRDSSEIDLDYTETNKIGHFSEEDSVCAASVAGTTLLKKPLGMATSHQPQLHHDVESSPSKKRRRSRKRSEEVCKRAKLARRSPRNPAGSDSDDTSENSLAGSSLDVAASSRSPKPSKHNFYVQLDPELDGAQRIEVLQKKLQELRTTYMSLKSELACIDRRRKKLRRREREEKCSRQQEVQCS